MANLSRLKGSQRIRQRAGVNLGSDDIRGVQQTFFEVVSNSIDRFKKGYGNKIIITKHKDFSYTVEDFADGLPMDWNENEKAYNWDLALKVLYAGENYEEQNRQNGELGYNGLGLTSTQYSSEYMNVRVNRDGYTYEVKCKKGRPVDKDTLDFVCEDDDYTLSKELGDEVLKKYKNNYESTGTKITYKPDLEVFTDINISNQWIIEKLRKQAVVNTGLAIVYIDEIEEKTFELKYDSIIDYLKELGGENTISDYILFEGNGEGQDIKTKPIYTVSYKFAFAFSNQFNLFEHYHNSSELTDRKSVTATSIEKALTDTIHEYLAENNLYNKGEFKIKFTDIEDSLICLLSSKSSYTSYANQTKLSVDNRFIKEFLTEQISNRLKVYFTENNFEANKICNQILINRRSREKAELSRQNTKKKMESEIKFTDTIKNFKPCKIKDKNIAELYLNEGSSALGGMLKSRNSKFQAGFHVGGKMKSLLKAKEESIFKNEVVNNLYKILGCGTILSKSKFNKEKLPPYNFENLNWSKIIISTDQDIDAYQIRCLILTCIYVMSPDLIEKGVVYIAEAPLFEITTSKKDVLFAYTEQEKNNILRDLDSKGIKYNTPERNKGLGEMEKTFMAKAIMNPETRRITKVKVSDVEKMIETFEIWLGEDITDRREIITNNFDYQEYFEDKLEKDIVDILNENYLPYAIDIVKNRAIIAVDGFKPSHRKLLWTLHEKNLYGKRTKSANIVGDNMAYNVHGDGSIYQTLVRMAQDDTLLYPYVNGKGNFGQHTSKDLDEAHMRYTEAGAADINKEFFKDINKNAVDLIPNFDGQKKEPKLLPTTFPNLLVNYNSGIAVGMASTTPSFPLEDVCNTTIAYILNKDINIIDYLPCPDFATGGYVLYDKEELTNIYDTGIGSVTLRAKYKMEGKDIIITEIPYTTSIEAIVDRIKELCKTDDSNFKCITNVMDSTELDGMSITIEVKKNTDIEKLMALLYLKTPLQSKQSFNMNIICLDEIPRVMGIKQILDEWLEFRRLCITRSLNYDIDNKNKKLHILYGFDKVILDLKKTIEIIETSNEEDIVSNLCSTFNIDEIQATEVANMKLRNINKDYIIKQTKDIQSLEKEIKSLREIKDSESKINDIIIKDLERVKNTYSKPRMTEILYENNIKDISKDDLIEDNTVTIVLTKEQYLKKTLKYSENQTVKDGDEVLQILQTTNKKDLLLFTSLGRVFTRKIYELTGKIECTPSALGEFIPNILKDNLDKDEKIIYIASPENYDKGYMLYIFENNNIVKMAMKPYYSSQNRMKPQDAFNTESPLKYIRYIEKDIDILTLSSEGKMLIQNTIGINPKTSNGGKRSQGNQFVKLEDNDLVGVIFEPKENDVIKFKTEKKDCVELNLSDICQSSKDKLTYYNHCKGKKNNTGSFVFNCRQKNDKIIELIK